MRLPRGWKAASAKVVKAEKDTEAKYLAKYKAFKVELAEEFRQRDIDM